MGIRYKYELNGETYQVELIQDKYMDGSKALQMVHMTPEGYPEPFMTITKWHEVKPADGCVWVKNYSENEGVADWLETNNIAVRTGNFIPTGFVILEEMKLRI